MSEQSLREYMETLFGGEDDLLGAMRREAEQEGIPTIQVPLELGRLLTLFILQLQARRVLEIGTLFGYSSIVMARALPADGTLITLEVNPSHADAAARNLRRAGLAERVQIRQGPALETLAAMHEVPFDLVFIDADKDGYPDYLEQAIRLARPGALIVADNVWRQGRVAEPDPEDPGNRALARFNELIMQDSRLFSTIVPSRDCSDAASVSLVLRR